MTMTNAVENNDGSPRFSYVKRWTQPTKKGL